MTSKLKTAPLPNYLPRPVPDKSFSIEPKNVTEPLKPEIPTDKNQTHQASETLFESNFPLKKIKGKYFESKIVPIFKENQKSFALGKTKIDQKDLLTKDIVAKLQVGFDKHVKDNTYQSHVLKGDLNELKIDLESETKELKKSMAAFKSTIETIANYPNDEELSSMSTEQKNKVFAHRLLLAGKGAKKLTLEDPLLMSFMSKDRNKIKQENPFLSNEQIEEIYKNLTSYLLTGSAIDSTAEALRLTEKALEISGDRSAAATDIANILHKKRNEKTP